MGNNSSRQRLETIEYGDGHKYIGNTVNGKKHGQGTYFQEHGGLAVGDWRNRRVTGRFVNFAHKGNIYTGPAINDRLCGDECTVKYADGGVYQGSMLNDEPHGNGTKTQKDGGTATGTWKNDELFAGTIVNWRISNGNTLTGPVVDGWLEGDNCTIVYPNGDIYKGAITKGKCNGNGTLHKDVESKCDNPLLFLLSKSGEWVDGVFTTGVCAFLNSDGQVRRLAFPQGQREPGETHK